LAPGIYIAPLERKAEFEATCLLDSASVPVHLHMPQGVLLQACSFQVHQSISEQPAVSDEPCFEVAWTATRTVARASTYLLLLNSHTMPGFKVCLPTPAQPALHRKLAVRLPTGSVSSRCQMVAEPLDLLCGEPKTSPSPGVLLTDTLPALLTAALPEGTRSLHDTPEKKAMSVAAVLAPSSYTYVKPL
jgi:hypothetical protein